MQKTSTKNEILLLAVGDVGAGFLSGLLGAGGGIILYFVLGALYGRGAKQNLVLSSVAVMFFCVISLFFYKGNSALDLSALLKIAIPAVCGGTLGALFLAKISAATVKKMFSVIVILSGILMLLR